LEQIGLEIRDAPAATRTGLKARLDCYQAELKRLQQDFTNAKNAKPPGDESLDEFEEIGILQEDQKRRLLDNSEKLERTGKHLNEGYRIVLETQEIGTQVLQDLSQQRETITRTRSRLREVDADLGRSSRLMNSMIMRKLREKFVLVCVGVVFLVAVSMSIYFSFSKST
jgi:vesicle transport through interaction with t-SNAREs 1